MKTRNRLLPALFALMVSYSVAQQTLVLQPEAINGFDAFLDELHPTTNFSNHPDFITFEYTFSGNAGSGKSLMKFDLSEMPSNCSITDARLSFFYNPSSGSAGQVGENASYLRKVVTPWNESNVAWNNMPVTTVQGQILLAKSTATNQDYLNINITDFVKEWYKESVSNYGFSLELVNNIMYSSIKFCSSDHADSTKRPKLVINYITTTGLERIDNNIPDFDMYPNPVKNKITVGLPKTAEQSTIDIFDLTGNEIIKRIVFDQLTELDLSHLKPGVYFLRLVNSETVSTKKFIKE